MMIYRPTELFIIFVNVEQALDIGEHRRGFKKRRLLKNKIS
jgi:hypothetical protein